MITNTGYKDNSPHRNNPYNIIPSSIITMQGVSKPLTLVPIIGGKPDYTKRVSAKPGDPDIDFGPEVEGVLEIPQSQFGNIIEPPDFTKNLGNDIFRNNYSGIGTGASLGLQPLNTNPNNYITARSIENNDSALRSTMKDHSGIDYKDPFNMDKYNVNTNISYSDSTATSENKEGRFYGGFNPYGGYDISTALHSLGALSRFKPENGLQRGAKAVGMLGLVGKIGFEGARGYMLGRASMNRYNQMQAYQQQQLKKDRNNRLTYQHRDGGYIPSYAKGGHITKMATGHYLKGDDNHSSPNAEVEQGEYVQLPDGQTVEVLGKKHSKGGELVNLPENTKIVSDYVKIGSKLARYFKKEFGLNVTSNSTFATVIDKFKKKIGLTDLLEEEENLLNKMKDQEDIKNEGTRELNSEFLREKYQSIAPKKQELEQKIQSFTNLVFERQESLKSEKEGMNYYQQGGELPQQGGVDQIQQIVEMYAQITGQDPQQIVQQLQSMPSDQQQAIIQEMIATIQQGGEGAQGEPSPEQGAEMQTQIEQQPQMRYGGYYNRYQNGGQLIEGNTHIDPLYQDHRAYGYTAPAVGVNIYDSGVGGRPTTDVTGPEIHRGHADTIMERDGRYYRVYNDAERGNFYQDASVPETEEFLYNTGRKIQLPAPVVSPSVPKENITSYDSDVYRQRLKELATQEVINSLPKKTKDRVKKDIRNITNTADKEIQAQEEVAAVEQEAEVVKEEIAQKVQNGEITPEEASVMMEEVDASLGGSIASIAAGAGMYYGGTRLKPGNKVNKYIAQRGEKAFQKIVNTRVGRATLGKTKVGARNLRIMTSGSNKNAPKRPVIVKDRVNRILRLRDNISNLATIFSDKPKVRKQYEKALNSQRTTLPSITKTIKQRGHWPLKGALKTAGAASMAYGLYGLWDLGRQRQIENLKRTK